MRSNCALRWWRVVKKPLYTVSIARSDAGNIFLDAGNHFNLLLFNCIVGSLDLYVLLGMIVSGHPVKYLHIFCFIIFTWDHTLWWLNMHSTRRIKHYWWWLNTPHSSQYYEINLPTTLIFLNYTPKDKKSVESNGKKLMNSVLRNY